MNDMTHSHVRHYLFIYEVTAALHDGITVESRVYAYTHTLLLSLTHANTHACTHTKEITETFNDGMTVEACIYTYTRTRTLSHTHTYTHTCTPQEITEALNDGITVESWMGVLEPYLELLSSAVDKAVFDRAYQRIFEVTRLSTKETCVHQKSPA